MERDEVCRELFHLADKDRDGVVWRYVQYIIADSLAILKGLTAETIPVTCWQKRKRLIVLTYSTGKYPSLHYSVVRYDADTTGTGTLPVLIIILKHQLYFFLRCGSGYRYRYAET
jgi:hypothetical protein